MENIFEGVKSFGDLFNSIKDGDTLVIVGNTATHWGDIKGIHGGDIGIEILGSDYILHGNSFDTDTITIYNAKDKTPVKIHNVAKLILKRDGENVSELSLNLDDNTSDEEDKNKTILPFYKEAYNGIMEDIKSIGVGNRLIIKTGQLNDDDEIDPDTISEIYFEVIEIFENGNIRVKTDYTKGFKKYENLENVYIKISPKKSFHIDQSGIKMEVITMKKPYQNVFISDVFDIEVTQTTKEKPIITFDDLQQDKTFRDLYNKEPSLFGKLLGKGPVGVYQINKMMDKYKLTKTYNTKNGKVKFKFNGKNISTGTNINLLNNEDYVGRFANSKTIKMTSNRRNITVLIKLESEIKANIYTGVVYKNQIIDGQSKMTKIGECSIKVIDKNFK